MKFSKILFVILALVIILGGVGFYVWQTGEPKPQALFLQPLFFQGGPEGEAFVLTDEYKRIIADYKKKILERASSKTPLTEKEKAAISVSIIDGERAFPGGIFVNQFIYRFNEEELKLISDALEKS